MKIVDGKGYLTVKLEVGEEIMTSLKCLMSERKIPSASFTGLGATEQAIIAYFNRSHKRYIEKTITTVCEIVNLVGNMAWNEKDEPIIHAHIALGFPDYHTESGHLVQGVIGVVGEIMIITNDVKIVRKKDDKFGLMLMDI